MLQPLVNNVNCAFQETPPRKRAGAATLALALGLLAGCRTTEDMQRDYAQTLTPKRVDAPVVADNEAPKQIREYKIRAYADSDYQRQSLNWSEGIDAQITRANRVLEAQFGVRLVLKEVKRWSRSGQADSIDGALAQLVALDSAEDVDWVVGFVSSLEVFAATQEQLGRAEIPGHHLVLRGMFSLAEVEALNATLDRLSPQERDNVTRERRLHKQTVVLLHEWAHTLGAFHERSSEWIMSPIYDAKQTSFSPESVHLLLASLGTWNATDPGGRLTWAKTYREEVTHFPPGAADEASLAEALNYSEALLAHRNTASPPAMAASPQNSASAKPQRRPDTLLERCYLMQSRSPRASETLSACRQATTELGASSESLLLLGRVLIARKEISEAVSILERAELQLSTFGAADTDTWVYLAQLFDRADTCTGAERAAKRAALDPAAVQVVKDCIHQRRSVALPIDVKGVPLEREHAYVEAVQRAQRDVDGGRLQRARAQAQELDKTFPGSPGSALINCLSDGHENSPVRVKASCTGASAAAPEAFAPWLLLGVAATTERRWDDARSLFLRAIELDEGVIEAWRRLATVYSHLGDASALAELKSRYHARFGGLLPVAP
jgi:tetratricopeptide (TPR) repeat protein